MPPELLPIVAVCLSFTTLAIIGIVALALERFATGYENRD